MAKRKAKKLTKAGRRRTGSTRGSGKRRSDRVAGARPSAKRATGRKGKRAGRRGVAKTSVTRARQARRTARKNVRSRAGAVTKPDTTEPSRTRRAVGRRAASTRMAPAGPTMPLRDLVRGGAPRSPKAHRPPVTDMVTPWSQRRSKTAHGLKSGGTVYQAQQSTRERYGGMKFSVPKRG